MYKFIDKFKLGTPYRYIHPYQQQNVKTLCEKTFDGIEYVIIFGSSVNLTCHQHSDLDVCVIGDFDPILLKDFRIKGVAMDLFHYKSLKEAASDTMLYTGIKEGVVVYDNATQKSLD